MLYPRDDIDAPRRVTSIIVNHHLFLPISLCGLGSPGGQAAGVGLPGIFRRRPNRRRMRPNWKMLAGKSYFVRQGVQPAL